MRSFNLRKLTVLLLLISLCFIGNSCKKVLNDPSTKEEVNNHLTATQYAGEPNAKKITFQQFLEETKGMNANVIQKFSQKTINSRQVVFSESANLVLVIDSLKKMNLNGHTTYTFPVMHDDADSTTFKNVMIDLFENKTEVFLISYTPSQQFLYNFSQKIPGGFSGTVKAEIIDQSTSALRIQKLKDNLQQVCSSAWVYTGTTEVLCPCTGHHVADQCTCDTKPYFYDNYAILTTCWTAEIPSGGGGGSGGTGGGGGGTSPTVPPNYNPCPPVTNPASVDGNKINLLPGGGTPCTLPTVPPVDIINKVKNPCLKAMVDAAINKNVNFNIKESMNSIFNQNTDFNLNFIDAPPTSFIRPTIEADTHMDRAGSMRSTDGRLILQNMDLSIKINTNLATGSKEYIAASIMHEAFHAYLIFSQTIIDQHTEMATKYITSMQQQLLKMFPNTLTSDDAFALAWGGLQQDAATLYSKLSTAQKDNITNANRNFRSGSLGQPCTP